MDELSVFVEYGRVRNFQRVAEMSLDLHNSMKTGFDYITCYSVKSEDKINVSDNNDGNGTWQCTDKIHSNNTELLPTSIYPNKTIESDCENKIRSSVRPDFYNFTLDLFDTRNNVSATEGVYRAFPFEHYLTEMRLFLQDYDTCTSHYLRYLDHATILDHTARLNMDVEIGEGYVFEEEIMVNI